MEEKEAKTIDLETNPKRIVLVDKNDTKERLEKLEKKLKMREKISKGAMYTAAFLSASAFASVFLLGIPYVSIVAAHYGVVAAAAGSACLGVHYIAEKTVNKVKKNWQTLREKVSLKEEAKTNPNIVIKEKSENLTRLEKKLNRFKPEAIEKIGTIPSAAVGLAGGVGGAFIGGYMGAVFAGGVTGGLCYLPFYILAKIAKKREKKLKTKLEDTIKTDHPDFYRQELLAEINQISEASKRELQAKEQEFAKINATYKDAQKCDSTDTLERLLHLAKNPQQNNINNLNLSVLNSGKGIV